MFNMLKTYFWLFLELIQKFVELIQKFVDLLIAKWLENFWIDPDPKMLPMHEIYIFALNSIKGVLATFLIFPRFEHNQEISPQ